MKLKDWDILSSYTDKEYTSIARNPNDYSQGSCINGMGVGYGNSKSNKSYQDGLNTNVEIEFIVSFSTPERTYYYNKENVGIYVEGTNGKCLFSAPLQLETLTRG